MMQQECMAAVVPDAGAILNSMLTAQQAPAERGYQLAAQRALGAAAEDSTRPMGGIICIAIPVSLLCWVPMYFLVHALLCR